MKKIKVLKMISYDESDKIDDDFNVGCMGGYFNNGMRWKDYIVNVKHKNHIEALREYIIKNKIKHGGDWHQSDDEGVPVFNDGKIATFTYRGWGDLMAATWSEEENIDYNYMDFYMDCLMKNKKRRVK